jgi:hypothetical protein
MDADTDHSLHYEATMAYVVEFIIAYQEGEAVNAYIKK